VGRDEILVVTLRCGVTKKPQLNNKLRTLDMKIRRSGLGLSILAGGLSFVGAANAVDIVIDGSYESSTNNINGLVGIGGDDFAGIDGGWTHFSTYVYSANYTQPGPTGSGQVYLRPYDAANSSSFVTQTNSLTRALTTAQIDGSQGQYTLSSWFCTYLGQNDYSDMTLQFLDANYAGVGGPVNIGGGAFVAALPGGNNLRAWGQDSHTGLVPPGARYAAISTQSHALAGSPDGYVDLVSLNVTAGFVPVQLSAATPANNATAVSPGVILSVALQDGSAVLNPSSVQMSYDNSPITPVVNKAGLVTTLQYDPPGLLAPFSTHSYQVVYNNTGGATPNTTNKFAFTVAPWVNIDLGTALYLENFDAIAEGALPSGWSVQSYTDQHTPGFDLNDVLSDSYTNWVVISRGTLDNLIATNTGDFSGTLNVAPSQVINGSVVTNLIAGNFIFAVSDRANNEKQIQYLFTRDYDLSGKANVYLSFHNIYEQNQDSMGSVEYSINGGVTWLPALYMLDGPDILRDSNGNVDASNTFAAVQGDVPDIDAGTLGGGHYGQYIGAATAQWAGLGPFISARVDDNATESKRVEIIRLAQADNQSAVRFRFAQVGTWSWYFGMDEFGLYSISSVSPPLAVGPTPAAQEVGLGNAAAFSIGNALGLGPLTYQWRHNGVNLPGKTSQTLVIPSVQPSDSGSYDVVISNAGGSVTSAPPAAVLSVLPVLVTGQWDFNGNLAATLGRDLQYYSSGVGADTTFGTTTSFVISEINGQPAPVMHFVPSAANWGGYTMFHGGAPNGGGSYVNQYTLIFDIYYPAAADFSWRSLFQTDTSNSSDGDLFVNPGDGVGISSVYDGSVTPDTWHRIALAVDLTGYGSPVLSKFIDGVKVGNQTGGLSGRDGRFALDPSALLFADNDGDVNEAYVSSVQFSNGRRPDAFLAALGEPSAAKIPGAIKAGVLGGSVVISWTGGVPLESADTALGPWTTVAGATSPYTPPSLSSSKLYRPKIP
jgi:hypothetical protein